MDSTPFHQVIIALRKGPKNQKSSRLTRSRTEELMAESQESAYQHAAQEISGSSFLLVISGEDMSVDSGLEGLDVLCANPVYQDLQVDPADFFTTKFLTEGKAGLFYGFWGTYYNQVKGSYPNVGYKEIEAWKRIYYNNKATTLQKNMWSQQQQEQEEEELFDKRPLTPWFFWYTSNLDSHLQNFFHDNEALEANGSIEYWQCSAPCNREPKRWRLPLSFKFVVDRSTMSAPHIPGRGRFASLYHNRPLCIHCGELARPSVLMNNDHTFVPDHLAHQRYEYWKYNVVQALNSDPSLKACILQVGCKTPNNTEIHLYIDSIENKNQISIIQLKSSLPFIEYTGVQNIGILGRPREIISEIDKWIRPNAKKKLVKFTLPKKAKNKTKQKKPPKLFPNKKKAVTARQDLLEPLNELLAYIDPNESVSQLIQRSSNINASLFDRIISLDSYLVGKGCIIQDFTRDDIQLLINEINHEIANLEQQQQQKQQQQQVEKSLKPLAQPFYPQDSYNASLQSSHPQYVPQVQGQYMPSAQAYQYPPHHQPQLHHQHHQHQQQQYHQQQQHHYQGTSVPYYQPPAMATRNWTR
eukprot:TRINITY_DN505_c0_g3_i2.p1 TRINITY_DN505_c0_g3~~TRINITY_DN505_c0_g3_i2.p1  ORF type:complete len:583 (-),score=106.29 TRINITY_DN505_c0_g3_i2:58-1806(-)